MSTIILDKTKVKEFARLKNITFEDMSNAIGRSKSYISYACQKETGIHKAALELLCRVYDVPQETFLPDTVTVTAPLFQREGTQRKYPYKTARFISLYGTTARKS